MSGDPSSDLKHSPELPVEPGENEPRLGEAAAAAEKDVTAGVDDLPATGTYSLEETVNQKSGGRILSIGPYAFVKCVGEGGMGSVWEARQEQPVKRRVALKLIKPGLGSKEVLVRFQAERQALAKMDHPNIARILDAGSSPEGQPYFAMEFVKGSPLTMYCDRHRLSIEQRLDLFCDACSGVQHAHQKGIIHRDLKPGNILVAEIDEKPIPKVIDFGLAKAIQGTQQLTNETLHTSYGQVIGTLKYMSPEQARLDLADIDTRTDIYALGVILYEILTGTTPLDSQSDNKQHVLQMLEIIRDQTPFRPSKCLDQYDAGQLIEVLGHRSTDSNRLGRILSGDLDWIVMKALAKDRALRYDSVAGFAADVRRFLENEPIEARPPSRRYRAQKFVRKHQTAVIFIGLLMATLIAGIIGTTWGLISANIARAAEADRAANERAAKLQSERRLTQIENGNQVLAGIFRDLDIRKIKQGDEPIEAVLAERLIAAGDQLETSSIGVPLSIAKMKNQLGYSLLSLGFAKEAIPMFDFARRTQEAHLGTEHPDTLVSFNGLGEAYHHQGLTEKALPLFRQTLEVRKSTLGTEHVDTLVSMNNLAECYRVAGNLELAARLMEETWSLRSKILGDDHQDTLTTLNNLALMHHSAERMEKALPLYEQSFELTSNRLGPAHPDTLTSMNNLAGGYFAVGRIDEALDLLKRVVNLLNINLGSSHPDTLVGTSNLAEAYLAANKPELGIPLYEKTTRLMSEKLGPDHIDTLTSKICLASAYRTTGQLDEAVLLYEATLELMRSKTGPSHPYLTNCVQGLAACYWAKGEFAKSIPYFEQELEIQRSKLGSENFKTLSTMKNLGVIYRDNGQAEEAIELLKEVVAMIPRYPSLARARRELRIAFLSADRQAEFAEALKLDIQSSREEFPPNSTNLATALTSLGQDLLKIKDYEQAEILLAEAFQIRTDKLGDDWRVFNTQSLLGEALSGQILQQLPRVDEASVVFAEQKVSQANKHLSQGYDGLKKHRSSIPPVARKKLLSEAINRLIEFAGLAENSGDQMKWQKELETVDDE